MKYLEGENARLTTAAAEADTKAQGRIDEMKAEAAAAAEKKEQECEARIAEVTNETSLKVAALQEQLRAAHDSVADSYSMVSQAQAKCVEEVEKARAKEAGARQEAKDAKESLQAEVSN